MGPLLALCVAAIQIARAARARGGRTSRSPLRALEKRFELDGTVDAGEGSEDCSEASKLVYVLSDTFDLLSFTPNTGT